MPLGLLDLSIVTDRLTDLLTSALSSSSLWIENTAPGSPPPTAAPPFTVHVSGDAPDVIKDGPDTQLSLFLFHVIPDKFQRNSPVTGRGVPQSPMQPMSLDLYYLLSTHSVSGYVQEQQVISVALKCFHENPIVRATVPVDGRIEEFCLTVEVQGWDELSRFWQATTSPVRLSVMYKVSVVFVEPPAPPASQITTSFVLTVDAPTVAFSGLGILAATFDTVKFTSPDNQPRSYNISPARVSAGMSFQVFGTDLRRADYSDQIYLTSTASGVETEITGWLNNSLSTRSTLSLSVPSSALAAGYYLVAAGHDFPASTPAKPQPSAIRSNGVPISIAASVLPTGGPILTAASGVYTVAGEGFVSGSTIVLLNSIALAETTGALGEGQFMIAAGSASFQFMPPTGLPSGTYLVRVQVAQVESAPGRMDKGVMITDYDSICMATEAASLSRVRLRARRQILWLRRLWLATEADSCQGLAIGHSEVDRLLEDQARLAQDERQFYLSDPEAASYAELICSADAAFNGDERWSSLKRLFGLSRSEIDMLSLCVAAERDPGLARVYGYLQDNASACYPTVSLAASLFGWPPGCALGEDSPLVRWHLAEPRDLSAAPWSVVTPWSADPFIVQWLTGDAGSDPFLSTAIQGPCEEAAPPDLCLYTDARDSILSFVSQLSKTDAATERIVIEVIGPAGSGKRTLARQVAEGLRQQVVSVDAGALCRADETAFPLACRRATHAVRLALLNGAVLYWSRPDLADTRLWQALAGQAPITIYGTESPLPSAGRNDAAWRAVRLPPLDRAARLALWTALTTEDPPPQIAGWILTPQEIANAARLAAAGSDAIVDACRSSLRTDKGDLVAPLLCPYEWADIVLPEAVAAHLKEVENQARLRWQVYEEWGFGRLCPIGRGITAMFAGPSGTGKTMAAQVIARSLGMDLYRVDLAGVMSKYIGETEKNLKQIFDSCERANVLLFFDEADALFGQRTKVKDAHDRFANIEIDYLLQRMEQFDGLAILATNRKADLDDAFLRRIRFIVDFLMPGLDERRVLWRLALLGRGGTDADHVGDIDWEYLAANLVMTGADIKMSALNAAFLARSEDTNIGMRHILHAARREMTKHGIVLRMDR